jgi:DNA-binding transcriptional regulator YiaG
MKRIQGWQVRQLRNNLGLTQEVFADHVGVSPITVSRWENGKSSVSFMAQLLIEDVAKQWGVEIQSRQRLRRPRPFRKR